MKKGPERFLRVLFGTSVAAVVIFSGAFTLYATTDLRTATLPVQFSLQKGVSLRSAAQQMESAGVLRHPRVFVGMSRLLGEAGNIKSGTYQIGEAITPYR